MTLAQRVFEEKRGLFYPILAVLALNAVLFAAVVYPLSAKVAGAEQEAQSADLALTAARRDFEAARSTVAGRAAADAELRKFYGTVLAPDQSAARRITFLNIFQLAKKSNVEYGTAAFDDEQERDSTLGKMSSTIALSGQYRDIRRFVYELETAPEFVILENVALSQGAESATDLNLTVKVTTYFQARRNGL
jgi:Tfp pilus assembly protein PilO